MNPIRLAVCLLLFVVGCSDPAEPTDAPCNGQCPAAECVANVCLGADGGADAPDDADPDDGGADADVSPDTPGDAVDPDVSQVCGRDDECPEGEICLEAACLPGCRSSLDCADGLRCDQEAHVCFRACQDDAGCGAPAARSICVDERCADVACIVDAHCDAGTYCAGSGAGAECVVGCRVGRCGQERYCDTETRECTDGCRADAGCPTGKWCDVDAAVCREGCREDVECPGDQICARLAGNDVEERVCRRTCDSDGLCGAQEFCAPTLEDRGACAVGCRSPNNCPRGLMCDLDARTCVEVPCVSDDACAAGDICTDGECVFGCRDAADCADGAGCVAGLCACTPELECADGSCFEGACRQSCNRNLDCAPGLCEPDALVCVAGCLDDAECPGLDRVCAGFCQDRACDFDDNCQDPARYCADGACRPGCRPGGCSEGNFCSLEDRACVTGCVRDENCGAADYCADGACVAGCRSVDDCGEGEVCALVPVDDDIERQRCAAPSCVGDGDCAAGSYCGDDDLGQRQVCRPGCRLDPDDCPAPSVCEADTRTCSAIECRVDEECGFGQLCDRDGEVPACVLGCRADADCGFEFSCVEETRQCTCVDSEDCPGAAVCDRNLCVDPCRGDDDCEIGTCDLGTGECVSRCEEDEDCPGELVCVEGGFCEGRGCQADDECANAEFCELLGARCTPGCRVGGCPDNTICHRELRSCVEGCRLDADCAEGNFCDVLGFTCRPGCRGDDDCDGDDECAELIDEETVHVCAPPACGGDEGCPEAQYCGFDAELGRTLCEPGCRAEPDNCGDGLVCDAVVRTCRVQTCDGDEACGEGRICDGVCHAGCRADDGCTRVCALGQMRCECAAAEDCAPGLVCPEGLCVEPCIDDGDCAVGQVCPPSGECREGCRADTDCNDPQRNLECRRAQLTCVGVQCVRDSDCGGAQYCDRALVQPRCTEGCRETGCPIGFQCSLDTRECLAGCRRDADCLPGTFCAVDTCRAGCRDDGDCPAEQGCVERVVDDRIERQCLPPTCSRDEDCSRTEYCDLEAEEPRCDFGCRPGGCPESTYCSLDNRQCEPGCELDTHCAPGFYCELQVQSCLPGCRDDDDCEGQDTCVVVFFDNARAQICLPPACDADSDCLEDEYCLQGAFEDRDFCSFGCRAEPDNCPEGTSCDLGIRQCLAPPCEDDAECGTGEYCAENFGFQCRVGCRDNDGCADGGSCDLQVRLCSCLDDGDCLEGTACDRGVCLRGCAADSDCGAFERCLMPEGVCFQGCRDDAFEPNDDRFAGARLEPGNHELSMCYFGPPPEFSQDCFVVELTAGEHTITAFFTHLDGDLDLLVFDAAFEQVAESTSRTDNELVTLDVQLPGDHTVCVRPVGADVIEIGYTLRVE